MASGVLYSLVRMGSGIVGGGGGRVTASCSPIGGPITASGSPVAGCDDACGDACSGVNGPDDEADGCNDACSVTEGVDGPT